MQREEEPSTPNHQEKTKNATTKVPPLPSHLSPTTHRMTSPDKPLESQRAQRVDSGGASWPPQQIPNPASSPVPPGFSGGQGDHHSHSKAGGDSSSNLSGAPPPGFVSDQSIDRSTFTTDMLQSKKDQSKNSSSQQGGHGGGRMPQEHKTANHPGALPAELAQMSGGRSSSFVNLAAVLGTGLAESMDDATRGEWGQHHHHAEGLQDLSLARQSRHAAARLIGASPPRADPLGLDVGSSFLGGGAAAPASLGGLHLTRDFQPAGTVASDSNAAAAMKGHGGGYLPGSFHGGSEGFGMDHNNRREYSPLSMFGPNANRRGQLPTSKDVGVTVMEPACNVPGCQEPPTVCNVPGCQESPVDNIASDRGYHDDSGGVLAALMGDTDYCTDPQCHLQSQDLYNHGSPDRDTFEVERGMRNLWADDGASLGEASRNSRNRRPQTDRSINSGRSADSQSSRIMAEAELRPFLWDTRTPQHRPNQYQHRPASVEPSRCLAILKAMNLQVPEIRSACEAFGVLETFRSDFADRGIFFVSYYDLRSAQYAALDLENILRRRAENVDGSQDITVYYCVPLNSSTQTDESRLILSDVPQYVDEHSLLSMLSSYGTVRSLRKHGGYYGGSSYEVEFNNVQDAKQALMELSSTQPWGPDVAMEVGMRPPIDRKRGRELLSVIGRWRHGSKPPSISPAGSRQYEVSSRPGQGGNYYRGGEPSGSADTTTQLVLGPDGRYSYVVVNNQSGYPRSQSSDYSPPYGRPHQHHLESEPPRQQVVHGPNGEIYITTVVPAHQAPSPHGNYRHGDGRSPREFYPASQAPPHHSHYSNASYHSVDSRERPGAYYSHHVNQDHRHHHHPHSHQHGSGASTASVGGDEKDNKHLVLDLDSVENGRDVRTSLMVRNIPNKYTQQMLLSEFTENGLGPGVIDFFYLPIDFKNRCNRGYAFINFVDFKDILPFHRRYFGKHWSTFNSDKICDITYARIQGKAAMLKRFENSALMEKDEEYKPLVFISHGPEKGKRIPFPDAAANANAGKPC